MNLLLILCLTQVTIVSLVASLLYLLTSRGRPSVRAALIGTAVFAVAVVTALSFCPLPSWWSLLPDATSITDTGTSPVAIAAAEENAVGQTSPHNTAEQPRSNGVDRRISLPIQWLRLFQQTMVAPRVEESTTSRIWPRALLLAVAIGVCAFLLRVAIGLRAIRRLYRQSRPLASAKVIELLTRVQQLAPYSRSVAVRESPHLVAAATIGWRRPVIVLPADWVDWSDDELLAVLAHEVAHVCRRDYPMRLIAYVVAALHFYHPLIHWLTRRLVQEQELAADTLAATLAGGRRRYLRALSRIALRQDDRPNVWPGSIALPVSSRFLMRRIEMLRAKDGSVRDSATKTTQWVSIVALVLVSVGTTAIRCAAQKPDEPDRTRVANRIVGKTTDKNEVINPTAPESGRAADANLFQRKPFDPAVLGSEGSAVFVIRLAELFRRDEWQLLKDLWNDELDGDGLFPRVEQIEFVAGHLDVILDSDDSGNWRVVPIPVMVRTTVPVDWKQFFAKALSEAVEKEYRQFKYLELPVGPTYSSFVLGREKGYVYSPDSRTLLFAGQEEKLKRMIDTHIDGRPRYAWADQWAAIDGGLLTVAFHNLPRFDTRTLQYRWLLKEEELRDKPVLDGVEGLCAGAEFICIGADWNDTTDRFVMRGRVISQNQELSDRLKQAAGRLLRTAPGKLENDTHWREQDKLILQRILTFLQSASLQSGKTPDGQIVVDGRIETEFAVDQLLQLIR